MNSNRLVCWWISFACLGVALLGAGATWFTWNKLEKMKMIRGWRPGAIVEQHTVREKWVAQRDIGPVYWLAFQQGDIGRPGHHRINLPEEVWRRYQPGDSIEIVRLPGNRKPYHRDGIYASDSNIAFDYGLLVVEIMVTLGATVLAIGFAVAPFVLRRRSAGAG